MQAHRPLHACMRTRTPIVLGDAPHATVLVDARPRAGLHHHRRVPPAEAGCGLGWWVGHVGEGVGRTNERMTKKRGHG